MQGDLRAIESRPFLQQAITTAPNGPVSVIIWFSLHEQDHQFIILHYWFFFCLI